MKKILKICAVVLAAAALFALTGCSARTSITADEFKKQAESAGFKVTDSSTTNMDVEKYMSAEKSETGTQLVYISFRSESSASETYANIKSGISSGTEGTSKNVDSSAYNKYTLVNGELNHTLVRMNKTIVYGKATTPHKNQMDDFFSAVKY